MSERCGGQIMVAVRLGGRRTMLIEQRLGLKFLAR